MIINQFEIWIADLNPQIGTETGKTRPILVVQTNLLNGVEHTSTIICPITTKIRNAEFIRVFLDSKKNNLFEDCEIMIDQVRALDNSRFIKKIGMISPQIIKDVKIGLKIVLDLE
ncbi:type II toxin-antitoxin system PemK/MazF family toxin [Kaistella jeonii]|uniref:mRNA interferase n=1 Tax=Kaistella jeonii TaxID=266749 RepID=A0A0C1F203_9FLAO|nr:type II toxin-antitoxin system PemK/MazF family toxin [Kaistella jeonii]KIA85993.1 taxon MazF [Kaistella jeonii]SFC37898.1 mRNA interferase MazF [Kaistella jeonii]VEI96821.1 mRNA interferase EndoA [Kaistella jeonii]